MQIFNVTSSSLSLFKTGPVLGLAVPSLTEKH